MFVSYDVVFFVQLLREFHELNQWKIKIIRVCYNQFLFNV